MEGLGAGRSCRCGGGCAGVGAFMKIPTEDFVIMACTLYIAVLVALVIMWKGG